MPRIDALAMEHLFNHPLTRIDLSEGHINLFAGQEGEGKSAILNALDLAITGRCRLERVDGDHLTNDALWDAVGYDKRPADEQPRVTIGLVGADGRKGSLSRGRKSWSLKMEDGTTINTKDGLAAFLGIRTLDAAEAALRSQGLLEKTSEDRVKLLFAALAKPLTVAELVEAGVTDEEIQKRVIGRSVSSGRALAAEKKQGANRTAASHEVTVPKEETVETLKGPLLVKDIPKERIEKQINDLSVQQAQIQEALGRAKAIVDLKGDVTLVQSAVEDAEKAAKEHAKAQAALKAALESEEGAAIAECRNQKALRGKEYLEVEQNLTVLRARETALQEEVVGAREALSRFLAVETLDVSCPTCTHSMTKEKAVEGCALRVKAVEAKIEEVRAQIRIDESGLANIKRDGTSLLSRIGAFDKKVNDLKAAEKEAREEAEAAARHATRSQEKAEEAKRALAERTKDDPSEAALVEKANTLQERIENSQRILSAIAGRESAWARYEEGKEKAKVYRAAAEKYGAMEEALSDAGFLAQRVQEPLALLRAEVDAVAKIMFRDDLQLAIGNDLTVTMRGRVWETGSKGQKWLMGAVLAAAFTSLSGFGVLVLDDFDKLGALSRDKVMAGLRALCQARKVEQVFIAVVRGRDGWCDACGSLTLGDQKGCCILPRDGKRCGSPVVLARPRGPMIGVLRTFLVDGGVVEEVGALGQAVEA